MLLILLKFQFFLYSNQLRRQVYVALILITCLFCFSKISSSQTIDSTVNNASTRGKLILLPLISYSPETELAFGGGGLYYLKPSKKYPETNPSLIKLIAIYSLEKQIQTEFSGDIYIKNNNFLCSFLASYYKFPQSFFGIGNDTKLENEEEFTLSHPYIRINFQRKILNHLSLGIKTFFEHSKISKIEDGGILANETITGEEGGLNTGAGFWATYDKRDNIYYPTKGMFIDYSTVFHSSIIGSQYNYTDNTVEVSAFVKSYGLQVIGFNLYGKFLPGNVPFTRMAQLGGSFRMRGNYEGRFRDKYYVTFQTEYRIPIWRRFGATLFGGIGEVGETLNQMSFDAIKYSYGGGLRLSIVPGEKINLRIDYGFDGKNDHGFYVQFNEAF